ncbi:cytochrome c [Paenibacillus sp. 2RAB27]|uniref:c-type cytochrome n=1 Tax=Paenibacillus sp. 2RAB27 TaxID=3232991 RepID=UPI003F9A09CF
MNKWMQASLCGMIIFAASGCSGKEASPTAVSPAAASATPSPAATTTATATPTPQASATAPPAATPSPASTASPVAAASATPQPQASATSATTPTPAPTPVPASATPAPTAAPTPSPAPSVKPQDTPASIPSAKAELLYKDNCLVCHGVGLAGDYGPNLTKVGSRRTKEQIVTQIMNGKVEMPPFKDTLKPDDIESLATWLSGMK